MGKSFNNLSHHELSANKEPLANKEPSASKEPSANNMEPSANNKEPSANNKKYNELFIDVSDYEQPIPFEKILQLLGKMNKGEYIRVHHRKKPLPLIQFLQENGFDCLIHQRQDVAWEIIIWNKKDTDVEHHCLTQFSA